MRLVMTRPKDTKETSISDWKVWVALRKDLHSTGARVGRMCQPLEIPSEHVSAWCLSVGESATAIIEAYHSWHVSLLRTSRLKKTIALSPSICQLLEMNETWTDLDLVVARGN